MTSPSLTTSARFLLGGPSRAALLWHVGRLPALLLAGHAGERGEAIDYPALVEQLLTDLPHTVDDVDRLIDNSTPHEEESTNE